MLANLKDVTQPALTKGYAVACFNVFGYEDALAVVQAAEARQASVILSINLDMTQFMPLQSITGMMRPLAEQAKVPVCLHLDHHYDIATVKDAIKAGFSSVMFDGSQLPIADNIAGIGLSCSASIKAPIWLASQPRPIMTTAKKLGCREYPDSVRCM